jgi:hypothetical protein
MRPADEEPIEVQAGSYPGEDDIVGNEGNWQRS